MTTAGDKPKFQGDGMKEGASQALTRQWAMLRGIPRAPIKTTVSELCEKLLDQGFLTSRRTVERDLHTLSLQFPLLLDDRSKPYGWSWMKNANFEFVPGLTQSQAVALLLARTHLRHLLPQNMIKDLAPVFDTAQQELVSSGWKDWHKRTAVVPSTLALLPSKIDPNVMATTQTALARKRCLEGRYRTKGSQESKQTRIHPLGLLSRGPVLYLVCTLFDYDDVRQLALHRLSNVRQIDEPRREPRGFDFASYAKTSASQFNSRGLIRLVAWFDEAAAEHLRETPLAQDQTWTPIENGTRVEVCATVEDHEQLRWWLLAFGSQVEVRAPKRLREDLKAELGEAHGRYV